MRLLVFGKTGQVARELQRILPESIFLGRDQADLTDPDACAAWIKAADVQAVINAAAWTAVDRAETDEGAATLVNGKAPTAMARAAATRGLPFLHISTDYVFDGRGGLPFAPDHPTAPLNAYGRSKLAGEVGIRGAGGRHLILRSSWVFSAHGANFVKTMLQLGHQRESLNVVADQIGGPTPAGAIAKTLLTLARALSNGAKGGTYHYAGAPDISWAGFARAVITQAGLPCRITDIPTTDYPSPARRPLNSRLDCGTLLADFGIDRPSWRAALPTILKEMTQ